MIGTAVSRSNCDDVAPTSSDRSNSTDLCNDSLSHDSVTCSPAHAAAAPADKEAIMQCYVGVAVALTFLAGIYQVSFCIAFLKSLFTIVSLLVFLIRWHYLQSLCKFCSKKKLMTHLQCKHSFLQLFSSLSINVVLEVQEFFCVYMLTLFCCSRIE